MITFLLFITLIQPSGTQADVLPESFASMDECRAAEAAMIALMKPSPNGFSLKASSCEQVRQ